MKIAVLNKSFELEGMIYDYISYEYSEHFNEAGEFSIELPYTDANMKLVSPESYIVFDTHLFVINKREALEKRIRASGKGFLALFDNVILELPRLYNQNPFTNLMQMMKLAEFESINFEVYTSIWNGGEYIQMLPYNCSVYSQLIQASSLYNFGFKVYFSPSEKLVRVMMMNKYDRSVEALSNGVILSDMLGDFSSCEYKMDISDYKNYAHVAYGFDSENEYRYLNVDWRKEGDIMRGMTVSIPNILISEDLEIALRYQGELALASHRKKHIYNVKILRENNLIPGEICTLESKKYGERCKALVRKKVIKEVNGERQVILTLEKEE